MRTAGLDFGLLNFGIPNVSEQAPLEIENLSETPAYFSLCESGFMPPPFCQTAADETAVEASETGVLSFYPGVGVLPPLSRRALTVVFRPHACQVHPYDCRASVQR